MDRLRQLIHEIHRRSLWQVLGIYVVASWAVLGGVDTLGDALGLPDWFPRLALGLLIVGLPVVLATAFVQERVVGDAARPVDTYPRPGSASSLLTWRNAVGGGVLAFALWGVVAAAWILFRGGAPRVSGAGAESPLDRSVAVLPFENRTADPEAYFSDGFADQLINAPTRIPDLRVTSRTSSFAFRDQAGDVRTIADRLGVGHLVSGSIQQTGERILVSAQLIESESGFIVWSDNFDRNLADIIDVQEDVAQEIARGLNVELNRVLGIRTTGASAVTPEAYDHYLRGRQFFYQRTPESFRYALQALERSIDADPAYAPAYASTAAVYAVGITYAAFPADSTYTFAGRALAYANRAIELDSLNAEAYAARGYLRVAWGEWQPGEQDLARAIAIQPSYADALGWHAQHLAPLGRYEEAWVRLEKSLRLDPLSPGRLIGVVVPALWSRRPLDALEAVQRARAIQPQLRNVATMFEALSLLLSDRAPDCLALDLSSLRAIEAMCLVSVGQAAVASAMVDSLAASWGPSDPHLDLDGIALYHAWVGRGDDAIRWTEASLRVSSFSYAALMWPPGVWDEIPAAYRPRVAAAIEQLRAAALERVLSESRSVEFP